MNGSHQPEDDDARTDPAEDEVIPEGSGKQFGEDVAELEETPEGSREEGKGFARGTPPEPTP